MSDMQRRTVAKAITRFLEDNPIEQRGDVVCGLDVRRRLADLLGLGDFDRTRVEVRLLLLSVTFVSQVLAYLIREPPRVSVFVSVFIEHHLEDVLAHFRRHSRRHWRLRSSST